MPETNFPIIDNAYHVRSEPVHDIIERMPTKFGWFVGCIIVGLVLLLTTFGVLIQYPDTVSGAITISTKDPAVKLVSGFSGKLMLNDFKPKDNVRENDYIAVIQNAAKTSDVIKIQSLLSSLSPAFTDYKLVLKKFPTNVSLGEINSKYYTFLNSLQKIAELQEGNLLVKQQEGLRAEIMHLRQLQKSNLALMKTKETNMKLYKKLSLRDSILLAQRVATESELDNSNISFLRSKENYQSVLGDITGTEQRINNNENRINQLRIQQSDEAGQLRLNYLSAMDDLKDNILAWEQHYVFKAPMKGQLEYLKFWSNNQQVQAGEDVFAIIPKTNNLIGHVNLPAQGAGKVKVGQDVIIKLDNFPFDEFGTIKGKVASISFASNIVKSTDQKFIDVYLLEISLPQGLKTNYGASLDFQSEVKGTADIISRKKTLLQRFFDNLRYVSTKE